MTDEQRRLTYLRESVEQLEDDKTSLEKLLTFMQQTDEASAYKALHQLRSDSNIYHVARGVNDMNICHRVEGRKVIDANNASEFF